METVPGLLDDILQDLSIANFKKFQWWLNDKVLDECKPIPKGLSENKSREDTVSLMVDRYGEELAVTLSLKIFEKMSLNNIKDKLKKAYEGKFGALSTSSSAPPTASCDAPPSVSASSVTMSAHHGSVVIAPTVGSGTLHINVNPRE